METMTFEEAKEYINSNPQVWLTPAKKRGYICPLCDNGAGNNGTGLELDPHSKQPYCYKCFKCGFYGDILQLIQDAENLDSKEAFKKACEIYGITLTADNLYSLNGDAVTVKAPVKKRAPEAEQKSKDYAEILHSMYNADNTHNACVYLQSRGISPETAQRLGFTFKHDCYDYNGQYRGDALIIPATREDSSLTYQERYLDIAPDEKDEEKHKSQWAPGQIGLFNPEALYQDKQPVFIVEGAIDASSIEELGFKAIAINSTSNTKLIAPAIQSTRTKAKRFILALDNDEIGRKTQNNFLISAEKALTNCVFGVNICEGKNYHDANEYLLHDREGLKKVLAETVEKVNTMRDTDLVPEIITNPFEKYTVEELGPDFYTWLTTARAPRIKTGLTELDTKLNGGFETGLYIIGGTTGSGKTTLILNMAYNIAITGTPVIVYSLEMTRYKIMARLLSKISWIENRNFAFKEAEIADYNTLGDAQGRVIALYEKFISAVKDNLIIADYIYSAKDRKKDNNVEHGIKTLTEEYIKSTGKRPVVMVDYLQLIDNPDFKDYRQAVDDTLSTLIKLKKGSDIPVIAISALNREAYKDGAKPSLSDFKESGRIEYDADVAMIIWQEEKDSIKHDKISVLKNRYGERGEVEIDYNRAYAHISNRPGAKIPPAMPY